MRHASLTTLIALVMVSLMSLASWGGGAGDGCESNVPFDGPEVSGFIIGEQFPKTKDSVDTTIRLTFVVASAGPLSPPVPDEILTSNRELSPSEAQLRTHETLANISPRRISDIFRSDLTPPWCFHGTTGSVAIVFDHIDAVGLKTKSNAPGPTLLPPLPSDPPKGPTIFRVARVRGKVVSRPGP